MGNLATHLAPQHLVPQDKKLQAQFDFSACRGKAQCTVCLTLGYMYNLVKITSYTPHRLPSIPQKEVHLKRGEKNKKERKKEKHLNMWLLQMHRCVYMVFVVITGGCWKNMSALIQMFCSPCTC